MKKIAVTGGIGSGKSTVCRIFGVLGAEVYDCDSRAKRLMIEDEELIRRIKDLFGEAAYCNGEIDRNYLSQRVFSDSEALARLNGAVHPAVKNDFMKWAESLHGSKRYAVMESAILFESGMDSLVDKVITVSAPLELRIERTVGRDGTDRKTVERRIKAQMSDAERERLADYTIRNDAESSLLEQVLRLDKEFEKS